MIITGKSFMPTVTCLFRPLITLAGPNPRVAQPTVGVPQSRNDPGCAAVLADCTCSVPAGRVPSRRGHQRGPVAVSPQWPPGSGLGRPGAAALIHGPCGVGPSTGAIRRLPGRRLLPCAGTSRCSGKRPRSVCARTCPSAVRSSKWPPVQGIRGSAPPSGQARSFRAAVTQRSLSASERPRHTSEIRGRTRIRMRPVRAGPSLARFTPEQGQSCVDNQRRRVPSSLRPSPSRRA